MPLAFVNLPPYSHSFNTSSAMTKKGSVGSLGSELVTMQMMSAPLGMLRGKPVLALTRVSSPPPNVSAAEIRVVPEGAVKILIMGYPAWNGQTHGEVRESLLN